ncbi:hypothetical protein EW026_g127 [Hermanssonia centrifuga]|uniref:Cyclin N-terminal domain-containing protein n=1 Tax=Hermanssonia centrifuga TaxID=98765 RepID=A0A4V3XBP0_9APHY|nr:hypothetical protein EW026_g127 [Hermanssonia centrifuga]
MPVPVPIYSKPPAHPVIKNRNQTGDTDYIKHSVFQHLTNSLPQPPSGPPPAFATREEWISSLPSWRRNKPRRIWEEDSRSYTKSGRQDFEQGLTVAGNATVIKGGLAQACIPPSSTFISGAEMAGISSAATYMSTEEDTDDEMSPVDGVMGWQGEDVAQFTDEDEDMMVERESDDGSLDYASDYQDGAYHTVSSTLDRDAYGCSYERGTFSPLLEEGSPDDRDSSPIGPATPFTEYVDRAVAESRRSVEHGPMAFDAVQPAQYPFAEDCCGAQCYECQHYQPSEQAAQQLQAPEPVVTPTATASYKRLAEPLSEWVANFVWKVCTTGMSLPPAYAQPRAFAKHYSGQPPEHLARSTHSMLLSTLLQPSAIFLALWYIVRLPVFFGPVSLGPEHVREMRFRAELLGDVHMAYDRDRFESFAPFRLILLGCMLANKWLDDHTFSNKTWHTISNVPVRSLNVLESLALELFEHNLSIPADEWSRWLQQLHVHHVSLSSPAFPQPISRPSASPHNIIRKAIETLMEVTVACENSDVNGVPEPVFYGLDDRKQVISAREQAYADVDVLEIDLDEDGPLREEYLPRRRVSGAGPSRPLRNQERHVDIDRSLPPPAKWSPAADEPIMPAAVRSQAQYVAPQPISRAHAAAAPQPPPAPFHQALDMTRRIWPADEQVVGHAYPPHPPVYAVQPAYVGYEYTYPPPAPNLSHSRSQSLSFNPSVVGQQPHGHYRAYSQTQFDGRYGDISSLRLWGVSISLRFRI